MTMLKTRRLCQCTATLEKVAEYTEKYGSLPRTIIKSPVPTPPARVSLQKSKQEDETTQQKGADQTDSVKENGVQDSSEEDFKKDLEIFSGRYSKREKEKWKHAVEMKNNPYSPENIEKRMKQSTSTISSLLLRKIGRLASWGARGLTRG
nr:unnamed protein product [Callosobruchus chinensis]